MDLIAALDPWHWWALAGVILVLELLTGTTYLLWPAAAAALVGVVHLSPLDVGVTGEIILFAVFTGALGIFGDRFVRPRWFATDKPLLNERSAQIIGDAVTAVDDFSGADGRVHYGDSEWSARTSDGSSPRAGARLVITGVDGARLIVAASLEV